MTKQSILKQNNVDCHEAKASRNDAFTLAETLITLVIIGVVAALTVPNMIVKHQKEETAVRVKKVYSEMNQAIRGAETTWGTIDNWDFSKYDSYPETVANFTDNYLKPNLKIMKMCVPSSSECWPDTIKTLDNTKYNYGSNGKDGFNSLITVSGYSIYYWLHATGLGGWFFVDINGPSKGPNRLGRDVFPFVMNWGKQKKLGFYPAYSNSSTVVATREDLINGSSTLGNTAAVCKRGANVTSAGLSCTALLAVDGWQIKDDYPW